MNASRFRLFLFALLSMLGFALVIVPVRPAVSLSPGLAKDAPPAPAAQEASVDLVLFHANPGRIEITTGTTVTWVNKEPFDYPLFSGRHELKADDGSFASPSLAPGTRWSHRFLLPGTFTYHCAHHSDLAGTIVVTGPPIVENLEKEIGITEDKPDDPRSWGFRPNDLIVTTGTTVVWRNNGTQTHTVVSNDNAFKSADIPPGGTFRFKFDQPGAFGYHCTPHPWMTASIRVVIPGGTAPPPPPPPPAAPPMAMTHRSAPSASPDGTQGPVRHDVDIVEVDPANPTGWTFDPPALDARAGDTVVWHNTGSMKHSVTASDGSFDSGLIPPGGTWSRTFSAAAFVDYHCTPHPWMKGIVRVATLAGGPPPAPPAGMAGARTSLGAPLPEAVREGSGPVTHPVNIVEPNLADAMGWGFNPAVVDIRAGDLVEWRNTGTLQHSVTSDSFNPGLQWLVDPGQRFVHQFTTPGVYAYHCTPHPWMKGIVRVTSAEGGAVPAIPAGLESDGSGAHQSASTAQAVPAPLHILADATRNAGVAGKVGLALLLAAAAVGLTMLLSWAWAGPILPGPRTN